MPVDDVLAFYGKKGAAAKVGYYFRFLGRFFLDKLAYICPIKSSRTGIHRLRGVKIGKGVYIGHEVMFDRVYTDQIEIGEHTSIGDRSIITAHANIPSDTPLRKHYPRKVMPTKIGAYVWIMPNVTVAPGTTIGDYAVIATGSVVTKSIPPMTMAAGSPAVPKKDLAPKLKADIPAKRYEELMMERKKMGYEGN
jgi:acetyltransferase-like isoleucine patch superfamily enzyme